MIKKFISNKSLFTNEEEYLKIIKKNRKMEEDSNNGYYLEYNTLL